MNKATRLLLICFSLSLGPLFSYETTHYLAEEKSCFACPAPSEDDDSKNWHCKKEILVWYATEEGLEYTNKPSNVLTTTDFTRTKLVRPHFSEAVGVRVAAGYSPSCIPWIFSLSWTYFCSDASGSRQFNSGPPNFQGIFPVWSMSPDTLAGDYVSTAKLRWNQESNIIDFDAQYNLYSGKRLTINPFISLRCAIIYQQLHVKYSGGTFFSGEDSNRMRNNFAGVGPRLGTGASYYLCRGFSLQGLVAFAALYGQFHTRHRESYLDASRFRLSNTHNNVTFSADYRIGIQWESSKFEAWPDLVLGLSWETHVFYRQNQMYRGNFDFFKRDRDLTLQGLTITALLCF